MHLLRRCLSRSVVNSVFRSLVRIRVLLSSLLCSFALIVSSIHQHGSIIAILESQLICNRICEVESAFGELLFCTGTRTHLSAEHGLHYRHACLHFPFFAFINSVEAERNNIQRVLASMYRLIGSPNQWWRCLKKPYRLCRCTLFQRTGLISDHKSFSPSHVGWMPELQGSDPRKLGPFPTVMQGPRVEKARTPRVATMYI